MLVGIVTIGRRLLLNPVLAIVRLMNRLRLHGRITRMLLPIVAANGGRGLLDRRSLCGAAGKLEFHGWRIGLLRHISRVTLVVVRRAQDSHILTS